MQGAARRGPELAGAARCARWAVRPRFMVKGLGSVWMLTTGIYRLCRLVGADDPRAQPPRYSSRRCMTAWSAAFPSARRPALRSNGKIVCHAARRRDGPHRQFGNKVVMSAVRVWHAARPDETRSSSSRAAITVVGRGNPRRRRKRRAHGRTGLQRRDEGAAQDTLMAQYNDLASVERLLEANDGAVAAVIVGRPAANMSAVGLHVEDGFPGFAHALRQAWRAAHLR